MSVLTGIVDRFFPFHPPLVGLDIAAEALKVVLLVRRGQALRLRTWADVALTEGVLGEGAIKDANRFAEALTQLWERSGLATQEPWVVATIPEEAVFIRLVSLPALPDAELAKAVELEVEATIPIPAAELTVDWLARPPAVAAGGTEHRDVVLSAAPKQLVETLVSIFEGSLIPVVALEPASHAFSRIALASQNLDEHATLLAVDLGNRATRVALVVAGTVEFSTTLVSSREALIATLARARHIGLAEAEMLLQHVGISQTREGRALFEVLEPALTELTQEVTQAVRYWQEHVKHRHGAAEKVEKIILVGSGAEIKGLAAFLAFHTGVPTSVADPFLLFSPETPLVASRGRGRFDAPSYATALGAALRGVSKDVLLCER